MPAATQARRVCAKLLGEVRRRDAHARDLLRTSPDVNAFDARDRAFVSRVVLGTIGAQGVLDAAIDRHLRRPHVEPKVRDALRVSAYELLFLSTPPSVGVSQGVELVRHARPRAAGMANAVLRRVADVEAPRRHDAQARTCEGIGSVADLELVSGYPSWLLGRVWDERGPRAAQDLALSALEPAPVCVAAVLSVCTADEARALLDKHGLDPRDTNLPGSFALGSPAALASSGLVERAQVVVSDLSAQRVARMAHMLPNTSVLEVGQGRGTKTLLLENQAIAAGAPAHVVGIDSEEFKVRVSRKRMERAKLSKAVNCLAFDACDLADDPLPRELRGPFDLVFVDAPCSGTGTLRRHPEIAWHLLPKDVGSLAELQGRMLDAASTRVLPGGALCYATCSVLRAEDEDVVERFLAGPHGKVFVQDGEPLLTLPRTADADGHFCVRLRREG